MNAQLLSSDVVAKRPTDFRRTSPERGGRQKTGHWRRPIVAAVLVGCAYIAARPDRQPMPAAEAIAQTFAFAQPTLLPGTGTRKARIVNGDYHPNNGWISSVGAAVSLGDFTNSGAPSDCILVDPRDDRVTQIRLEASAHGFNAREIAELKPDDQIETSAPMGTVVGDFDGDGWMDVLVYYWGRLPVVFLNPHKSGTWRAIPLVRETLGIEDKRWFTNCVCQTDIDGDGRPDFVIGNYFPSEADVLNPHIPSDAQEMQDSMSHATNGGRKYVLLNRSDSSGMRFVNAPIEVEDNDGLTRTERATEILKGWTLAIGAADLDGDFLPELYLANDFGPDRLLFNLTDKTAPGFVRFRVARGDRAFDVPKSKTLGRDSFKGMGVDFTALNPHDEDAGSSILVSNIAEEWALLESHFAFEPTVPRSQIRAKLERGVAPYRDHSEPLGLSRSGWGWDIKAVDLNNDGIPEIAQALGFLAGDENRWAYLQELATGNDYHMRHMWSWPFFRTQSLTAPTAGDAKLSGDSHLAFFYRPPGQRRFVDIGAELYQGAGDLKRRVFPDHVVSRGIAVGDIDHDGLLDLVVANQWETSFAYRNVSPHPGNFAGVRVVRSVGEVHAAPGVYTQTEFQLLQKDRLWTVTPVIGARVVIKNGSETLGSAIIDGSNGHSGHRAAEAHIGLSDTDLKSPLTIEVQWRRPRVLGEKPERQSSFIYAAKAGDRVGAHPMERSAANPNGPLGLSGWWIIVVGEKNQ